MLTVRRNLSGLVSQNSGITARVLRRQTVSSTTRRDVGFTSFRTEGADDAEIPSVGGALTVSQFEPGQTVDVRGTSKGKGFAGAVKRWNFSTQDTTHGNSISHRALGSVGQCQTPGKVFKGKKMAGQLGNKRVTIQNLKVVAVDVENDLILVKGAVPGPTGGDVFVCPAIKDHGDSGSRN